MLSKSQHPNVASQNAKLSVQKKLRFDEENLRETHHPITKDYGFMAIPEAKTPFPRHADPIAAEELHRRLLASLERANKLMQNSYEDHGYEIDDDDDDDDRPFNMNELRTPLPSLDFDYEERRRSEFYKKRQQFNQAEFIIAQQKSMSSEMPEPGPSINPNGGCGSSDGRSLAYKIPSNISQFIKRRPPHLQSSANDETLRVIAKQMSSLNTLHM